MQYPSAQVGLFQLFNIADSPYQEEEDKAEVECVGSDILDVDVDVELLAGAVGCVGFVHTERSKSQEHGSAEWIVSADFVDLVVFVDQVELAVADLIVLFIDLFEFGSVID